MLETQETQVLSLGWKDPLEEGVATHCSVLAWEIPWIEEPGGLQTIGSQRVGHDGSNWACTPTFGVYSSLFLLIAVYVCEKKASPWNNSHPSTSWSCSYLRSHRTLHHLSIIRPNWCGGNWQRALQTTGVFHFLILSVPLGNTRYFVLEFRLSSGTILALSFQPNGRFHEHLAVILY